MNSLFSRRIVLLLVACAMLAATGAVGTVAAGPATADAPTGPEESVGADQRPVGPASVAPENDSTLSWDEENRTVTAASTGSVINVTYDVNRTPGDVGRVRVNYTAALPENVVRLFLHLEGQLYQPTVESTDGFEYNATVGAYEATSPRDQATTARLTYTVGTNTTAALGGGLNTVETRDWALIGPEQVDAVHQWSYYRPAPELRETVTVDGEGYAAERRAFLGPADVHRRTTNGQSMRVVVPDAASPTVAPEAALDSLGNASRNLDVGDRDSRLTVFVAPDPIRRGGRTGGNAGWVHESSTLDADSTWLHEYVHTRQAWVDEDYSLEAGSNVEWFTEASADYYGARLTWRDGTETASNFRQFVSTDQYATEVLQDANNESTEYKNYYKGRRVMAALDIRIRQHTDGSSSLLDVFRHVNSISGDKFWYADVRGKATDLTNASTGTWLDTYVKTDAAPDIPPLAELKAAYEAGSTADSATFAVTSLTPERASITEGETVNVTAGLRNDGNASGTATVEVRLNGSVVETANVTLQSGSEANVTSTLPTDTLAPGNYTYGTYTDDSNRTGTVEVTAAETAPEPTRTLSSSSVTPGGSVTVTLEADANGSSLSFEEAFSPPFASASVDSVTVDGASANPTIEAADPSGAVVTLSGLSAGETVTVEYTVSVPDNASVGATYDVSGNVTSGDTVSLGTDTITVEEAQGPVAQYDGNGDGDISIGELGQAASDYALGRIGIATLGQVAAAYASS